MKEKQSGSIVNELEVSENKWKQRQDDLKTLAKMRERERKFVGVINKYRIGINGVVTEFKKV